MSQWTELESIEAISKMASLINHPNDIYLGTYRFTILHHDKLSFYSIGDNSYGQCGTKQDNQRVAGFNNVIGLTKMPMKNFKFEEDEFIKIISNGHISTLLLTNKHKLYACGGNSRGQFGSSKLYGYPPPPFHRVGGAAAPDDGPIAITLDAELKSLWDKENIVKIAMGYSHVLVLSEKGSVWSVGDNHYQQIGLNQNIEYNTKFKKLLPGDVEMKCIDIECGQWHSLCVTDNYDLIVFGRNDVKYSYIDDC